MSVVGVAATTDGMAVGVVAGTSVGSAVAVGGLIVGAAVSVSAGVGIAGAIGVSTGAGVARAVGRLIVGVLAGAGPPLVGDTAGVAGATDVMSARVGAGVGVPPTGAEGSTPPLAVALLAAAVMNMDGADAIFHLSERMAISKPLPIAVTTSIPITTVTGKRTIITACHERTHREGRRSPAGDQARRLIVRKRHLSGLFILIIEQLVYPVDLAG
jgi:hypothetical protein